MRAGTSPAPTPEATPALSFMGDTKGGAFDISAQDARLMLDAPNPHGRPNSDVIVPWANGLDITRRPRDMYIIDFGVRMSAAEAAMYEAPFAHVERHMSPDKQSDRREAYKKLWWRHTRPRPDMLAALSGLPRFLVTLTVAKHRLFAWLAAPTLPDHQLIVFARSDDYFFGVLHSRAHRVWSLAQGTQLEDRPRYTPTTCFETFPFPEPTPAQAAGIADAAGELDSLRSAWLNPPEWTREEILEFPASAAGPWAAYVGDTDERGVGTARYPRRVPRDAKAAALLAKRTLTNLYNEPPAWLRLAHERLDRLVCETYGWHAEAADAEILSRLLALNLARAANP